MLRIIAICALIASVSSNNRIFKNNLPFGIVEGIVDCGSYGELGMVQVTDCTLIPCKFVPNNVYDVSIRFTASQTRRNMALHIYKVDLGEPIAVLPINGEIEAGIEYELAFELPVSSELAGMAFDVRFYIWDLEDNHIEICAEAGVEVTDVKQ